MDRAWPGYLVKEVSTTPADTSVTAIAVLDSARWTAAERPTGTWAVRVPLLHVAALQRGLWCQLGMTIRTGSTVMI